MSHDDEFQNTIFRYRSIDSLLGEFQELERQSIYFSPPERLNDPMEGLRQLYWRGDRITWRNLLRHYIICLFDLATEYAIAGDQIPMDITNIRVFRHLDTFPTPESRKLCEECLEAIEKQDIFTALLGQLDSANREISFSELCHLLITVHIIWLCTIHSVFHKHSLVPNPLKQHPKSDAIVDYLNNYQNLDPTVRDFQKVELDVLYDVTLSIAEEMNLLKAYQNSSITLNRRSLFLQYPNQYLKNLIKLIYPPWYVACFSARNDNAAMWSYYANNHNGCCLVFKTETNNDEQTIDLEDVSGQGSQGLLTVQKKQVLNPVRYEANDLRIEFFTNIGQLSLNNLMNNWFQDNNGETSPLSEHLSDPSYEQWRRAHWENFEKPLLRKLPDWEHEQEYRIVLPDMLNIHGSDEGRLFTYDYSTLKGIIFGINVTTTDKIRIMKIVDQKLSEQSNDQDFTFYQARYNSRQGKIEVKPLRLLKHTKN